MTRMRALVIGLLLAGGCEESDEPPPYDPTKAMTMMGTPTTPPAPGPTEAQKADARSKCEQLRDLICSRVLECRKIPPERRTMALAECRASFGTELDCGAALGTSEAYPRCMKDLADTPCTVFLPANAPEVKLPASCTGVIHFPA